MNIYKIISTPSIFSPDDLHLYRKAQLLNFLLLLSFIMLSLSSVRNLNYYLAYGASLVEFSLVSLKIAWCVVLLLSYYLFKVKNKVDLPAWACSLCVIWVVGELAFYSVVLAGPLILLVPIILFSLIGIFWGGITYLFFAIYILFIAFFNGHIEGTLNPNALFYNYLYSLILGGGGACFLELGKLEVIDKLYSLASKDPLTQCWNRSTFIKSLDNEILKSRSFKKEFSLAIFDIDNFKQINDTYGHPIGDIVLKEFVNVINENIRDGDIFARWGGEEFTLILSGTNMANSITKIEKVLSAIRLHQFTEVGSLTSSVGLISYTEELSAKELFHEVDIALYKAKKLGRDRLVVV